MGSLLILWAQEIPKEDYITYMPLTYPKIKKQTDASEKLHLYGNRSASSYRDINPVDGIDD